MNKRELELYIHIPFCARKCAYCDFLSFAAPERVYRDYMDKLLEEICGQGPNFQEYRVSTIFVGGGTPSILPADLILERFATLCALLGASMEITGNYPAWEYKRDSALRDTMVRVFTEQYGHAPKIEAIHAGLECGLFSGKLPGLDCVSFGPDLLEIHTPREKMSIPSVQRTWKLLRGVLEALA